MCSTLQVVVFRHGLIASIPPCATHVCSTASQLPRKTLAGTASSCFQPEQAGFDLGSLPPASRLRCPRAGCGACPGTRTGRQRHHHTGAQPCGLAGACELLQTWEQEPAVWVGSGARASCGCTCRAEGKAALMCTLLWPARRAGLTGIGDWTERVRGIHVRPAAPVWSLAACSSSWVFDQPLVY